MSQNKILNRIQVGYILKRYHIKITGNYEIRADGLLDVNGSIKVSSNNLFKLPLKFNRVTGDFICKSNSLTSLRGSPKFVGGTFDCSDNKLISLKGGPDYVGASYFCQDNNLIDLKGSPIEVIGRFNCALNKLKTLQYGPEKIGESYYANYNQITSLIGCARQIGRDFHIEANLLNDMCNCPDYIGNTLYFDIWIPSLNMGQKNCVVKYVKIEALEKLDNSLRKLPQRIINNQKYLPIIFKYSRYLDIWNNDGSLNNENLNDILFEIKDGLL